MPEGNGNGGSSGGSSEVDYGELINNVGGLVDELFDGNFWTWISQLGCMSSDFKLSFLKDRFPMAINAMRERSGVDMSMTLENVNDFSKRLAHHYTDIAANPGGGCRGEYSQKYLEMLNTYRNELHNLFLVSGFKVSNDTMNNLPGTNGFNIATNYNQSDINVNGGYGFQGTRSFGYRTYLVDENYSGGNYVVIDDPNDGGYTGGGIFDGGGVFSPTMSSFSVMNYALGGILAYGFYLYAKENKMFKK